MTVAGWLVLTLGVVVWPHARPPATRVDPDVRGKVRGGRRDRLLAPAAGVGASLVAVATGGFPSGVVAALVLGPATAGVVEWLRRRPQTARPDRSLALALDLVAAVLRGGGTVAVALETAAPAARPATGQALIRVARLLTLGAGQRDAWAACAGPGSLLEPVAAVAVRSQASGLKLADAFERLATDLRDDCAATAAARANRAGVQAMGPLAACFLPSFVCLGIVPVVVGLAAAATHTLR